MEILVAILIIVAIAAIAFAVVRSRPANLRDLDRRRASPLGRRRGGVARHDPMAAAVEEHARAMDPADVVIAEQRLQAQARQVAAGMHNGVRAGEQPIAPGQVPPGAAYGAPPAAYAPAAGGIPPAVYSDDPNLDADLDPVTGERIGGYEDPANDPRLHDRRYDGRLAADWVDPREDPRRG
jgi:hypothetical protein